MRYRTEVLATGGSRDAIDHLRAFLGREPSSEAFLAKLGLR
jgi:Zn-dependent oligopeptidase